MVSRSSAQMVDLKDRIFNVGLVTSDGPFSINYDEEDAQQKKFIDIMRSVQNYEPSQCMSKALCENFTNVSLVKDSEAFKLYLESKDLDYDNVEIVMRTLLNIEDLSNMKLYSLVMQKNKTLLKDKEKNVFSIILDKGEVQPEDVIVPHLDEVVLIPKASLLESPQSVDIVAALVPHAHEKLKRSDPRRRYVASVEQVSNRQLQFKFKKCFDFDKSLLDNHYDVIVRSSRMSFRYMYRAIELLGHSPDLRRYLFPKRQLVEQTRFVKKRYSFPLINNNIADNIEQLGAVHQIVAGPRSYAPFIIFGPPGTGKTTLIVEAILQLRMQQPRSRILVTAGSNSACDTIAIRLLEYIQDNPLINEHIEKQTKQSCLVTMDVKPKHQLIRVFSYSIYVRGLRSINKLLLQNSNCRSNVFEHISVDKIRQYGIIVTTLCTVGKLVTKNLGKFNFFTHVFLDEVGASMEPESLVGIVGIKQHPDCHVILSGDHKQLGPVIKSDRAASLGLSTSLMERLLARQCYAIDSNGNYDLTIQTRLVRNYRSHSQIVHLYNTLYYNNTLIAEARPADVKLPTPLAILPNREFPIIFQATHGNTAREECSTSSLNALEAQVLMWYVRRLLEFEHINPNDIGIIAPYKAQCKLLSKMLNNQGYNKIEIGCVENYQGREKSIIIVSLVRSFLNLGFVSNPRRLNVMLSRAKSLLILIGNPVTLRNHGDFNFIINECRAHGTYIFKKKERRVLLNSKSNQFSNIDYEFTNVQKIFKQLELN